MKYRAKFITLLGYITFLQIQIQAQDKLPIKFGKVTAADFDVKSPLLDSSTNAIVVADIGNSEFMANTSDFTFSLLFKEKKRIRIINKNGFDAGTVIIPIYIQDNNAEKLIDLDAFTYNIENGKVVAAKVDKASIFTEKKNEHWMVKKFTFPALKEGSIIEYSYTIKSDFFFNLHAWEFQGQYPVMWSQYEAAIPEFFRFLTLSQGYHQFTTNSVEKTQSNFSFTEHITGTEGSGFATRRSSGYETYKIDGAIDTHKWIMKDLPALKEEAFTTTIDNSISKIEFQLQEVAFPKQLPKAIMNSWEKASEDLLQQETFGTPINRPNNWLDNEMPAIIKSAVSLKEKTKKIYEYLRDNFTCTSYNYYHTSAANLKEIFKNKSGTVADINMLLIAMLRNQKITADPVILSTRSHGRTNEMYPIMEKYNYVIAQASIDNQNYYLDASRPCLAFNKLPVQVYNGHARLINKEAAPVYFVPDSINEYSSTLIIVSNVDKGIEASLTNNMGYYQSLELRNKLEKTTLSDYKKAIKESYPEEIVVSDVKIDSLKLLDEPVALKIEMKLNGFGENDIVYFNPMLGEGLKKNPFTAAERFYPVEMPYPVDNVYLLNMDIPTGYKVDELPKSARVKFNEDEGMFEYLISATAESIQLRCRLVLKKATYTNEDYQSLRDLYGFVVSKEAEQIVFKKIK